MICLHSHSELPCRALLSLTLMYLLTVNQSYMLLPACTSAVCFTPTPYRSHIFLGNVYLNFHLLALSLQKGRHERRAVLAGSNSSGSRCLKKTAFLDKPEVCKREEGTLANILLFVFMATRVVLQVKMTEIRTYWDLKTDKAAGHRLRKKEGLNQENKKFNWRHNERHRSPWIKPRLPQQEPNFNDITS